MGQGGWGAKERGSKPAGLGRIPGGSTTTLQGCCTPTRELAHPRDPEPGAQAQQGRGVEAKGLDRGEAAERDAGAAHADGEGPQEGQHVEVPAPGGGGHGERRVFQWWGGCQ